MATLPDVPQNTIVTLAVVAGSALVAYNAHLRSKLDGQIHENTRQALVVVANVNAGADIPSIHAEKSSTRSA